MMDITHVVMGGILLLFGRRLFWMFVGTAGFFAGAVVSNVPLSHPALTISYIALAAGGIFYQGMYLLNFRKRGLKK